MTKQEIHIICKKYSIKNYTINDDMSIDVNGNVNIWYRQLEKLPLKFCKVNGYFDCRYNKLTSLEGCPTEVGGYFNCNSNKLTTLESCPTEVGDDFWCNDNNLTTLEGAPKFIGGYFYCNDNPIYKEFVNKFNNDYNLYLKYIKRQKILNQLIND